MLIKKAKTTILALDQALNQSGYAVFNSDKKLLDYGIIKPDKNDIGAKRFCTVRDKIKDLYQSCKPNIVLLEPPMGDGPQSEKGAKTFSVLSGTYWMNRMIAEDFCCKEVDIPASVWQNRIGAFSRDRIKRKLKSREFAMKEYDLSGELEQDIYDAICIAYAYFYQQEFQPGTTHYMIKDENDLDLTKERRSAF